MPFAYRYLAPNGALITAVRVNVSAWLNVDRFDATGDADGDGAETDYTVTGPTLTPDGHRQFVTNEGTTWAESDCTLLPASAVDACSTDEERFDALLYAGTWNRAVALHLARRVFALVAETGDNAYVRLATYVSEDGRESPHEDGIELLLDTGTDFTLRVGLAEHGKTDGSHALGLWTDEGMKAIEDTGDEYAAGMRRCALYITEALRQETLFPTATDA